MFHDFSLGRIRRPIPPGVPDLHDHRIMAERAPLALDRRRVSYQPQMFDNDEIGCCTCAAVGNAIIAQAALAGFGVRLTAADVAKLYGEACGYVPGNPATDRGGVEVDVLSYQAMHGFACDGQVPYVGLWANLDHGDLNLLRLVMARLGVGYLGVNLALADQNGGVWDTDTPAGAGDPTPGSWGGHALCIWSYTGTEDTDLVDLVTWGALQPATWRWVRSRMDEAHALVHPQMLVNGLDWAGIDRERLVADVDSFGGN